MIHVLVLLGALLVGVTAELVGVVRHKDGKVDTYTEIIAWLSNRFGYWFAPVLIGIVGLMAWAIPHLLMAGNLL